MADSNPINGDKLSELNASAPAQTPVAMKMSRSNRPSKRTGWLKVLLASAGIAVTVMGTGLIAQQDADATRVDVAADTGLATMNLEPVPTAAAPVRSAAQLNSSGAQGFRQLPTGSTFPGPMAQSRSSR